MISLLLGILSASIESAVLSVWLPHGWYLSLCSLTVIYLFRFGLKKMGWQTAWWSGFWLDCFSGWRFGVWLFILPLVGLVADLIHSRRITGNNDQRGLVLAVGVGAAIAIIINVTNNAPWFGAAIWSATISAILYSVAARKTIDWRLYA